ncbi:MAG TPA: pitrilysin family protein [Stellaceae bacterium]|nr:pitrilysin family protein [Stellaceae bacterium]
MTRLTFPRLVALALLLAPLAARADDAKQFNASTFTLANGLQVVVAENHRAPIVTQMVWYKVGSADEVRGKTGLAHFLEHLMFKGTKDMPPGAFSRLVAQNGGRENAFTTADYTAYYQNVAADRLELMMKLEADRMTGLVLEDKVVLPERDVILEERRMRIDNNPSALLNEQVNAALFLNHPYHNPVIGWEHEMAGLTTEDALAFYRTWYAPNNAVLVIGGDVTPAQVHALAEKYFGPLAAHAVPPRHRASEPPKVAATRLVLKSPRVGEPSWNRSYLAPSYAAGDKQYAYALQVLAEALGGGATSRLYHHLVLEQNVALSVGASYNPGALDLGTFAFYATPRKGVAIAEVEAAVEAEVKKLLADGLTAEEVARAKQHMQSQAVYSRDSLDGPARIIGAALVTGRSLDDVETWPAHIGAVTVEEVNAAARLVIHDDIAVTGILLPEPTS